MKRISCGGSPKEGLTQTTAMKSDGEQDEHRPAGRQRAAERSRCSSEPSVSGSVRPRGGLGAGGRGAHAVSSFVEPGRAARAGAAAEAGWTAYDAAAGVDRDREHDHQAADEVLEERVDLHDAHDVVEDREDRDAADRADDAALAAGRAGCRRARPPRWTAGRSGPATPIVGLPDAEPGSSSSPARPASTEQSTWAVTTGTEVRTPDMPGHLGVAADGVEVVAQPGAAQHDAPRAARRRA